MIWYANYLGNYKPLQSVLSYDIKHFEELKTGLHCNPADATIQKSQSEV